MILEALLEQKILSQLAVLLSDYNDIRLICSRQSYEDTDDTISEDTKDRSVIAVVSGLRQNDNFSIPTVMIPVTIAITTRLECDKNGNLHEELIDQIMSLLQYWHDRSGNTIMSDVLSSEKLMVHDIVLNGGSGRILDRKTGIWSDTINMSFKGTVVQLKI